MSAEVRPWKAWHLQAVQYTAEELECPTIASLEIVPPKPCHQSALITHNNNGSYFMSRLGKLLELPPMPVALKSSSSSRFGCGALQNDQHPRKRSANARRLLRKATVSLHDDTRGSSLEDTLVGWLVSAGRCSGGDHNRCRLSHGGSWPRRRASWSTRHLSGRTFSTRLTCVAPTAIASRIRNEIVATHGSPTNITPNEQRDTTVGLNTAMRKTGLREEYKELVDLYDLSPSEIGHKERVEHFPLASRLVLPPEKEDIPPHGRRKVLPPESEQHRKEIEILKRLLFQERGTVSHTRLWNAYESLQRPQLRYLSDWSISRLFSHLSFTEYKHFEGAKHKIFSLLDQCGKEHIPLQRHQWTIAITFAGRCVRTLQTDQVRSAIETWMRMEDAGLPACSVVFNVLFDIAAKAGRFALADTIYNELRERGMGLDRYFRCSMIYYAGMRRDGDAVRAAFNEFVNAGEIVDTAVMNCVVRSLIRAGEGAAAEHVFLKMKAMHEEKFPSKYPEHWSEQRTLARRLQSSAAELRQRGLDHESSFFGATFSTKDNLEELQRNTPIHPNARTYRLLIGYHALVSGDVDRVVELMQEMKEQDLKVHGSVYDKVFQGFCLHGGYSASSWKLQILEHIWKDFTAAMPRSRAFKRAALETFGHEVGGVSSLHHETIPSSSEATPMKVDDEISALSEEDRPPRITYPLAQRVINAFYKCAGKKRMLQVWWEITSLWDDMQSQDHRGLELIVRELLREHIWEE